MRQLLLSALLLLSFGAASSRAEPPTDLEKAMAKRLAWTEDFEGDPKRMLGGGIEVGEAEEWTTDIVRGALRYRNTTDSTAVRYYALGRLKFPGFGTGYRVDGAQPSATVKVEHTQNGAAGLVVGYTRGGDYLLFGIGTRDQFAIFEKHEGKLRIIETGNNAAIKAGSYNNLTVTQYLGHMEFSVNGAKVYEIDRPELTEAPVGIAAAGKGTFLFDEVTVQPFHLAFDEYRKTCPVPKATAADEVVMLNFNMGVTTSSVALDGQEKATSVIDVNVEPGTRPIYVVASSSEGVIWRVKGDSGRIARFLMTRTADGTRDSGVVGLPPDKVSFEGEPCIVPPAGDAWLGSFVALSMSLGRVVDQLASATLVDSIALPSAVLTLPDRATAEGLPDDVEIGLLNRALKSGPGGVARIDPREVVSSHKVEAYQVLPEEWGILQLIKDGTLVPHYVNRGRDIILRITAPMRFPAGLTAGRTYSFYLLEGVPFPLGDRNGAQVITQLPIH